MRKILPALPTPRLTRPVKSKNKQRFQLGDTVRYSLHPSRRGGWYSQTIIGVKRYRFGLIRYRVDYTIKGLVTTQKRLIKMQETYRKHQEPQEAKIVKPKRHWLAEVEGQW